MYTILFIVLVFIPYSNLFSKAEELSCNKCHLKSSIKKFDSDEIKIKHQFDSKHISYFKCAHCHFENNMNLLVLKTGDLLEFQKSSYLCGQCHGIVFRDWTIGLHGKKGGGWIKQSNRWNCTQCHNPHHPTIPPMEAFPISIQRNH